MRVVAGKYGGRRIKDVPGKSTRSTTDKVKEATFHRIGPYFDGGICLDLFAGSGALGIEAISRGMDHTYFIDSHPKAIKIIHENINALNIEQHSTVKRMDAKRALDQFKKSNQYFDLILIDPPYHSTMYENILHKIDTYGLLKDDGLIYCEHDKHLVIDWGNIPYNVHHSSTYGTITTTLLSYES